jgi:(p)ppGpp synthase/HD superfamily hydrolase
MKPATKRIVTEMTDCAERMAFREFYRKTSLYGEPYIMHLMRVAEYVDGSDRDEDAVTAAFLHDMIEDVPEMEPRNVDDEAEDLRLAGTFSKRAIDAVKLVTFLHPDNYDELSYPEKERLYLGYIQKIIDSKNRLAIDVKIADLNDHLWTPCPDEELTKKSTEARRHKYGLALQMLQKC